MLSVPSSTGDRYTGNGMVTFEPRVLATWRPLSRLRLLASLGYLVREQRALFNVDVGNELTWSAAIEGLVLPVTLSVFAELFGRAAADPIRP